MTGLVLISFAQQKTFTNPLLPSGADPFSIYKGGYYYYTNTMQDSIVIWKTRNLATLATAQKATIFVPAHGTNYSKELWAPEIHFIKNKWYVYFAGDNGNNNHHRIYVLENASADPMNANWTLKGKLADSTDKWAIDGTVLDYKGKSYFVWSGWEGDTNGQQNIYIAKMKNPWTLEDGRVKISGPVLDWEMDGDLHDPNNPPHVNVNEGPQPLVHNNRLFLIYSASGCWTDSYALGMLTFKGGKNLLKPEAWVKSPKPVFKKSITNGVYAPGHNSFFKSPDGKEDWILYHANAKPGQGCGRNRSPRIQRFTWNKDGTPFFGEPVKTGTSIAIPSQNKK
ncbi:MAG: glycosyl hydrolase family 43 [Ferruginibacter sp.]|nr:glycosyl hydrolase family 43 [Ferruginibacter sp.]